jgi:hypothetical protein
MNDLIELNETLSRQGRDQGMSRAIDTANRTHDNWSERAYELLQRYLKSNSGEFMAEDVRAFAAMVDFPLPENPRAWGGIFNRAIKETLINKVGIGPVKNKKAHCANANIYSV